MLQVAFWAPKGGVGKTTLALNMAAAARERGLKVLVCDMDPQRSATDLFNENKLPFSVVTDLPVVMPNVDLLIYDHSPHLEKLPVAETIVLPMRASMLDLKAVNRSIRLVRDKRIIKCVNAVDSRRQEERMLAMKLYQEGALLIKDRSIYVRSVANGETVFQSEVFGSREAQQEVQRLLDRVLMSDQQSELQPEQ